MTACLVHVFYTRQTGNYISQQTNKLLYVPFIRFFNTRQTEDYISQQTNKLLYVPFIRFSFYLRQTENCKDFSHVNIRPQL
jgi:hypothetical protein